MKFKKFLATFLPSLLLLAFITYTINFPNAEAKVTLIVDDDGGSGVYTRIQDAINAANPGDTISVKKGIYSSFIVGKSLLIKGEDRNATIVDGEGSGIIVFVTANDVRIQGFTIKNGTTGIYAYGVSNLSIVDNIITKHNEAMLIRFSNHVYVEQNSISNCADRGVLITNSQNFVVRKNEAYQNVYGLNANGSAYGLIVGNKVYENGLYGIGVLNSTNCVVFGNTVTKNPTGISVEEESANVLVYDNNLINNFMQGYDDKTNNWDNGIEGNYWRDYVGNDTDNDGIGDTPHLVWGDRMDYRPLMGPYSSFNVSEEYSIGIVSNSTISDFTFFNSNFTMRMHVSNSTTNQTFGFLRVCIPYYALSPPFNATIDGINPYYWNYALHDDGQNRWIYFAYQHTANEVNEVIIRGSEPPDIKPPKISILSPENKTYTTKSISLIFALNEPTSWIGYSLDGSANITVTSNISLTIADDRAYSIIVYANDTSGNMGKSEKVYFTIDTTPPSIIIQSPENKSYKTTTVSLNFTINEPTSWKGYSLDGQANVTLATNKTLSGLTEGIHRITLYANDTFGHMGSSETVYFKIDTTAPIISILSPENKTYTTSSITLNFTINEAATWIRYSLDGQANQTISGNTTLPTLADGAHKVRIYMQDTAGNTAASAIVYFTVNTQQEAFPTWMLAVVGTVGVAIAIIVGAYFVKTRKAK